MEYIKEKLQKQIERVKAAENVRDPEMSHFHAEKAMLMALRSSLESTLDAAANIRYLLDKEDCK